MENATRQYHWIRAGSRGRNYSRAFLKYGCAFAGKEHGRLKSVRPGDRLILLDGSRVKAVGEVLESPPEELPNGPRWHDVQGWNLPLRCSVTWYCVTSNAPVADIPKRRGTIGPVPTTLHQSIERVFETTSPEDARPEPSLGEMVEDETLLRHLMKEGVRSIDAERASESIVRLRRLAQFYRDHHLIDAVGEHETRTFLIVPFLVALGWSEQQMKIELGIDGGRVDLACFERTYCPSSEDCVMIVETKGLSQGLAFAPNQAKKYARQFSRCRLLIVANGLQYQAYERGSDDNFPEAEEPTAYLDILNPRDKYPLDDRENTGALELLSRLLPSYSRI